jgi:arsenite/tail-anchored protein-transporting ATPase
MIENKNNKIEDDLDIDLNDLEEDDFDEILDEKNKKSTNTLSSVIENTKLKWIYVGGKGGVGKTTISSCLSLKIAEHRKKNGLGDVLIISTDPAHNLSDAFDQQFCEEPRLIKGTTNLYGMEISPKIKLSTDSIPDFIPNKVSLSEMVTDIGESLPGKKIF